MEWAKPTYHQQNEVLIVTNVSIKIWFSGFNTGLDALKTVSSLCHVSLWGFFKAFLVEELYNNTS